MFENLSRYFFKKYVQKYKQNDQREHRFVNYKQAVSVLLLFVSDDQENNEAVKKMIEQLKHDGKKVMALGFVNKKEVETPILQEYRLFGKKDVDSFQRPRASVLQQLESFHFDLLIDLSLKEEVAIEYLTLQAQADFKAGSKKNDLHLFDFVLDTATMKVNEAEGLFELDESFIYNQIIFYLKSIQTSD